MDTFECPTCGGRFPADVFAAFCPDCRDPMFVAPDGRPRRVREDEAEPLRAFRDFLPLDDIRPALSLGEGRTPLLRLDRLAGGLGLPRLFAKNEAQNPTGSFKDRGTAVAVQKAVELGFRRIGTVSTGNMAASTAAYGARAGLETIVLLKEGTSGASLRAAAVFGPRLFAVRGDYPRLFFESLRIGRAANAWFMNSIDPYRVEGYKLTAYEIARALRATPPTHVVVPVSAGGHVIGLMRGFDDFVRAGLLERYPTIVGVQAEGCGPVARAFAMGRDRIERFEHPETIAHAISNPAPAAGNVVLAMIRKRNGLVVAVSDEAMLSAQRRLAAEGLFVQPESAATLAGLEAAKARLDLGPGAVPVLVLTGSGLKAMGALDRQPLSVGETDLEHLEEALAAR